MAGLRTVLLTLIVAAAAAVEHAAVAKAGIKPVEKVINLLEKLLKESEDEGMKEAQGYDKYACFCKAQADAKILAINKDIEKTEILTARIEKLGTEINRLNVDIEETQAEIASVEKTMAEEKAARAKEHNEFSIRLADLQEAIRGADDAVEMMQGSGGSPLLLVQGKARVGDRLGRAVRRAVAHGFATASTSDQAQNVMSLLEFLDSENPAAFAYHSGHIIDVVIGVEKEFKERKNELESEEATKKFEFDSAQLARAHQRQSMMENVAKNEQMVSKNEDQKAADEADKEQTIKNQAMDQTFLDELIKQCEDTAKAWDQRSKTRANELMALTEATEIMKGKVASSYGANKKLNLVSEKKAVKKGGQPGGHWVWVPSFLQLGRAASGGEQKVADYLDAQANKIRSPVLASIALKVKAGEGEDHFAKVRTMIKDMIAKLEADAEAEQTQKAWCDEQMGAAMEKRDENIGAIEGDFASITESKAQIASLKEEVETLTAEIADLYKALNEQTELRKAESAENATTLKDARAGLNAVRAATQVLKDFYEANAFVQFVPEKAGADGKTVGDLAPKTGFSVGGDYSGKQDAASGIIGLMEVITSDFEGTIEATEDGETRAQEEYDNYKSETDASIAEKKDAMRAAKQETAETEATLFDLKDDLKEHTDLKKEALNELSKLKPSCVSTGSSYAERVARREQEIESLKNAKMLLTEMTFLQK